MTRRSSSTSAFVPINPLPVATSRARSSRGPTCQVTTVSEQQLTDLAASCKVVVLKCFANYCRSCKGVEAKFRKIAKAYEEDADVTMSFVEMDYANNESFCKDKLGVKGLPFFGMWVAGEYVGGEAMGWQSVGKKLTNKIDQVIGQVDPNSSH